MSVNGSEADRGISRAWFRRGRRIWTKILLATGITLGLGGCSAVVYGGVNAVDDFSQRERLYGPASPGLQSQPQERTIVINPPVSSKEDLTNEVLIVGGGVIFVAGCALTLYGVGRKMEENANNQ